MRHRMAPVLAACLVVAVVAPSQAAPRRAQSGQRTLEATYSTPAAVVEAAEGGVYACSTEQMNGEANVGCVAFPTKLNERFVSIEIVDGTGLPAPAWVTQDGTDFGGPVCGATDKPLRIAPGLEVWVWIYPFMADPLCSGIATTGTVTATFSGQK